MTDEELDKARADEAWRLAGINDPSTQTVLWSRKAVYAAARLAREGWMPVDPLLLEAREIYARALEANDGVYAPKECRSGLCDDSAAISAVLAALRRGIEIGEGK